MGNILRWAPLLLVFLLALTSVGSLLSLGSKPLGGWALMAHVTFGAAFLGALAVMAVHVEKFDPPGTLNLSFVGHYLFLLLGMISGGTVLLAMFPLLGTRLQMLVLELHFISGLLILLLAIALAAVRARQLIAGRTAQ